MEKNQKFYYGWYIVAIGFLIMGIVYATLLSCQGAFMKPVTEEFGISRGDFSLMITLASLGLIIGSIFMGKIFEKYSIKKVMIICIILIAFSLIGFSAAKSITHFYLISPFLGIAFAGGTTIPVSILINNWFGVKKKGLAMSLAFAGSGVGGMTLTMILNKIIISNGWRAAYLTNAAIILLVVLPVVFVLVVESPKNKGIERIGEGEIEKKSKGGLTLTEAKKTYAFWGVFISFFIVALMNSAVSNHLISYLSDIGIEAYNSATIAGIATGSLTIGKIVLGSLCDKLGLKKSSLLVNVFFALAMITLLMISKMHTLALLYIFFFCIGGAAGTICPPLFVSALFGEKQYGTIFGIVNVALGLGSALGALVCGKIYDAIGNYNVTWVSAIILSVIVIILQLSVLIKKPNDINDELVENV